MQEKRDVLVIEATKPYITNDLKPKENLRVCAYARVSTNQLDQINSYNAQIEEYSKRIKENPNWEFAGLYSDEGISGTSYKNRKGFNKMLKDARAGLIDKILVKSISRFSRNTIDSLSIVRELRNIGVEVFFEKENISSLDSKVDFHLTIFSSIAQEESRNISENIKWGIRKGFKRGKMRVDTNRFLGYDKDKDGNLVINPEQAETVQYIFMLYLLGESYNGISRHLLKEGRLNGAGKISWGISSIKKMLLNEKYVGDLILQKTVTVDYLTRKTIVNNGEAPKYYIKDNHPAIISRELFDAVGDLIKNKNTHGKNRINANKYPLSGLVYCSRCGRKLVRNHYRYKTHTRIVLTCKNNGMNTQRCSMYPIDNDSLYILVDRVATLMGYTRKESINSLLGGIGLKYDEDEHYEKINAQENEIIRNEQAIKKMIDLRLASEALQDDKYLIELYETYKKNIEIAKMKIDSLKHDLAATIATNKKMNFLKDYLESENLLYKEQVAFFLKRIIVLNPHSVVIVQGDFDIPEEMFLNKMKEILDLPSIKEGEIYSEKRNEMYKYKVVKYDERILDI
ncbi:MAG: recombinase family protein [Acholeplasmataceae bacterium]|jgi:site-specific DNA recombinase